MDWLGVQLRIMSVVGAANRAAAPFAWVCMASSESCRIIDSSRRHPIAKARLPRGYHQGLVCALATTSARPADTIFLNLNYWEFMAVCLQSR